MRTVLVLFGTRPEAIKMAPVIHALRKHPRKVKCVVCSTGQHRIMVDQVLEIFDIEIDIQLDAMRANKGLAHLTARLFKDIDALLERVQPDWLLVQGDTTSAFVGAMCAYYRRIRVGHVEAGLRTNNRWSPFPEEMNRVFISHLSDAHFAPTARSARNLKSILKTDQHLVQTGNTIVDALHFVIRKLRSVTPRGIAPTKGRKMILVTCHRRESFGAGLESICGALLRIATERPDIDLVFPVHLNPRVKGPVEALLGGRSNIKLLPPQPYLEMIKLMKRCHLILSDSGGIQEEAPTLKKPLLVLREVTERPEVLSAGCAVLVGTDANSIVKHTLRLLDDPKYYARFTRGRNPFGDGKAGARIAKFVVNH